MRKTEVDIMEAMAGTTLRIRVTRVREWKIRMWLGCLVLRLGGAIMGSNIELEVIEK